jgi:hypothetical protein
MNVKQLIKQLEQIENKFLEVEIYVQPDHKHVCELDRIGLPNSSRKKVVLFTGQERLK